MSIGAGRRVYRAQRPHLAVLRRREPPRVPARERQSRALMAEGHSNTAIAQRLVISASAVEKHISNVFAKLGLPPDDAQHRRVLAVLAYLRAWRRHCAPAPGVPAPTVRTRNRNPSLVMPCSATCLPMASLTYPGSGMSHGTQAVRRTACFAQMLSAICP